MTEKLLYDLTLLWIVIAVLLFPLLIRIRAPYGRHASQRWGPMIDNRTGWIIMEIPSLLLFMLLFLSGNLQNAGIKWVFFSVWVLHYFNRIFIFPLRTKTRGKQIPVLIVLFAMVFNLVNGFLNGFYLGHMEWTRGNIAWLTDPRFIIGIIFFISGFFINQVSDNHLIRLRRGKKSGYYIPTHRLFRRVSCPNFAGEIIEWSGFAIMTWSLPGLSFAIWTMANLIPRALHHHNWYRETFDNYPEQRKAVIPCLL